ncbi:MAG: AsnC family transcriptional regulator [Paracoccaceae bacterium]|nr:AsnC family transcriptional regulator [Paracoccaceae bacterium]
MIHLGDPIDQGLLNDWQRDLPLVPRPFAAMGRKLGIDEEEVIARLETLRERGSITRVGATCAPNTVSASTLAAISAPDARIEEVAEIINRESGINHSYLREDDWNLWFVATGPDRTHVNAALARIERRTGLRVLDLPLVRPFNIDLGFNLNDSDGTRPAPRQPDISVMQRGDRDILQTLCSGLPLVPRPFALIGARLKRPEDDILARISALHDGAIITRFGVIVRHRALGWRANAMVVWDLPHAAITRAGPRLAAHPGVTLCYERRPVPGIWPWRLYSMIHARSREAALDVLAQARALPELRGVPCKPLFSVRCFRQTGALIKPPVRPVLSEGVSP